MLSLPNRAMCDGKKRYHTMALAVEVRDRASRKTGDALRIYACPICRSYHLTSMAQYDPDNDAWDNLRVLQALVVAGVSGCGTITREAGIDRTRARAALDRAVAAGMVTQSITCGVVRYDITNAGRALEARWAGV